MPVRARLSLPRRWEAVGREAAALARQALLMRHDAAPVVPHASAGDDVVVLVHGMFATAGVLRPLRQRLERLSGARTACFTYPPGPGVAELCDRLSALVGALPEDVRLHLVGHSLGGIVARCYAQERGDPRVVQTISLASPFSGIVGARHVPLTGVRDMDPGSAVLRRVLLGAPLCPVPHLSILAGRDVLLSTPASAGLTGGEVALFEHLGHNTLLFDRAVAELIARRLLDARARAVARSA